MKKKVVILALTLGYGGIEKYISSLCKMLQDKYEVSIICDYKEVEKPAFNFYNAKIEYLINHKFSDVSVKNLIQKGKYLKAIGEIVTRIKTRYIEKHLMIKRIKNIKADAVITTRLKHNYLVNKFLKNTNIIKIATEHNSYDISPNYDINICKSVSNYNYLVFGSKIQKQHYEGLIDKCIYIPNVIDNVTKGKSNLTSKNIISIGRFSPEKGFLDLIKVMNEVVKKDKDIKLYLAGDGYQKQEIVGLIKRYNLDKNIILLGFQSPRSLSKYYLDSSLYVMTSYSEFFGLVLVEAMSYGLPCIAFDSAKGAVEILNSERGFLIKNRDIKKMANNILSLLGDRKKLLELQKQGNKYVKNYDINRVSKKWDEIIK